jgi:ATP-binding cassette subfamily A (ABC1) protein 3
MERFSLYWECIFFYIKKISNGAGKTSTFKILSGEITQTSGEAHIQGFDLATEQDKARQNIGYCP